MQEHWKPIPSDTTQDLIDSHVLESDIADTSRAVYSTEESRPAEPHDPANILARQRLKALRKSPGFKLIAHSLLFLQTWQMDMDYPPSLRGYVRKQMRHLLKQKTGQSLSPDKLHITFTTQDNPAVASDGTEHFNLRLSLTELGMACFDPRYLIALARCPVAGDALSPAIAELPASTLIALLHEVSWELDYDALFAIFWRRHERTYRALTKLSFLDQLERQLSHQKISRDGYYLALNALGLEHYPASADCLAATARGEQAELHMLALDGDLLPGIFQLRSKATSHCFIHTLGRQNVIEYISDDPQHMTARLLEGLNNARGLIHLPDSTEQPEAILIEGDLFDALTRAQKNSPLIHDGGEPLAPLTNIDLLKPIKRGLALVSAVDVWNVRPAILEHIPSLLRSAAEVMHHALRTQHGLSLNPDNVFIRYLPGTSVKPLGNVRQAPSYFHVPDDKPISLSNALINNYRVEYPTGYIDEGAQRVVYLDPTGKGKWATERALSISPEAIEETIKTIDFLALMTEQLKRFWQLHTDAIEEAYQTGLIAQAVICLKCGSLTRSGFDTVVKAINTFADPASHPELQWSTLGFDVYSDFLDGVERQYCASLLVLDERGTPKRILYQPGQPKAFTELVDQNDLIRHLRAAAANKQWRESVLAYIPDHHQERLDYLLKIWGGQAPLGPASLLRPWTDINRNPDVHDALAHKLREKVLSESPLVFVRKTLERNGPETAQRQIVTSREILLRYWTRRLSHLQLLLAPMSLLLTPAALASMAIEVGLLSLDTASANLPGRRSKEKLQAILSALSMGLFSLTPATPRLLQSLRRLATTRKVVMRASPAIVGTRGFGHVFDHSAQARRTQLEPFFRTNRLLKTWKIPGNPHSSTLPVKVWKLGRRFLLWTSDRTQASILLVSTHGYHLPWSRTLRIPSRTSIYTYVPHGYALPDPGLSNVAHRRIRPFAVSNGTGNTPIGSLDSLPALVVTDQLMAGSSTPGKLRNYTLSKYQGVDETYEEISNVVSQTNRSPSAGQLPAAPMDVLTVRNRFGMPPPALEDLFNSLADKGIHYDRILLVHCRCSAIDMLLDRVKPFTAPMTPLDYP